MSTPNLNPTNFKLIKDIVARGLFSIKYAKGSYVYLTPSKIIRLAGLPKDTNPMAKHPVVRHLVRYVMDELVKYGYMDFMYRTSKKKFIYCVHCNSPLWTFIKQSNGPEDILSLLEKVVE